MKKREDLTARILTEQRNISRYAGMIIARAILLLCLFILLIPLQPFSFYTFFILFLYPLIQTLILEEKHIAMPVLLSSCAKKYFYTPERYLAERRTSYVLLFLLVLWQILFNTNPPIDSLLHPAPAILLFLYLLCRIFITIIIKHQIHHFYSTLEILDY